MTSFDELIERTARKLEKDSDLFNYYNISSSEAEALLKEQITGYIYMMLLIFCIIILINLTIYLFMIMMMN